jgi:hypothetical protein
MIKLIPVISPAAPLGQLWSLLPNIFLCWKLFVRSWLETMMSLPGCHNYTPVIAWRIGVTPCHVCRQVGDFGSSQVNENKLVAGMVPEVGQVRLPLQPPTLT